MDVELIRQSATQMEDFTIELNFGTTAEVNKCVRNQVPVKEKNVTLDKSFKSLMLKVSLS